MPNDSWFGNEPVVNRYDADGRWFGRPPVIIADAAEPDAAAMIPKIQAVVDNYVATQDHYRFWPGPTATPL
jgi:hypothetical protein